MPPKKSRKAQSIKTPGTPKANGKQYSESKHRTRPLSNGVKIIATRDPALMAK
jgi:hypothetical protein